jgi:hypothetical protein
MVTEERRTVKQAAMCDAIARRKRKAAVLRKFIQHSCKSIAARPANALECEWRELVAIRDMCGPGPIGCSSLSDFCL